MVINSISFSNDRYVAGSNNFLLGNVGDLVTCILDFTTTLPATAFDFYFNLIPNSEGVYAQTASVPTSTFEIPNSRFNNRHTNTLQSYRGAVGTLNAANPINWNTGGAVLSSLGINQYRITHTFLINPLFQGANFVTNDYEVPTWFNGLESLKYLFRIDCRANANDPNVIESTNSIDLTTYVKNGNVGFMNERFNNVGSADYTLVANSLSYNNGNLTVINPSLNTVITFQIKNNAGMFLTTHKVALIIQIADDDFNVSQNYLLNLKVDRVLFSADSAAMNGNYISLVSATINATDSTLLDVTLTVNPNTYATQYAIFCSVVANIANISNANHNNVFITQNSAAQGANGASVELGLPSGYNFAEFNFVYHYSADTANSFNHIRSFAEDRLKCVFKVFSNNVDTVIQSCFCGIKRLGNGAVIESQRFNFGQVPIIRPKNWKIKNTDYKANFEAINDGSGFVVEYPFQISNNWIAYNDLVFFANFQCIENGQTVSVEWQSPYFELQTYNLTKNSGAQPILTKPPATIQYYALPSLTQINGLLRGGKTLIVATFEEDNLNNLQRTQAQLVGYFGLNVKNGSLPIYRQFHSIFEPEPDTPFEPDTTFTSNLNSYVNKVDIDTVELRGVLDWNKIIDTVGQANCYDVTARMDSIDPVTFRRYDLPFHFRSPYLNYLTWQLTTAVSTASLTEIYSTLPLTSLRFKTNNNNVSWASVPYKTMTQFLAAVATLSVGDWIYIETTQLTYIDAGIIFKFIDFTDPITPSVDTYNYSTIDQDHIWWFDTPIVLNSIVSSNASATYAEIRVLPQTSGGDFTLFNVVNIAGLNASIAALPSGTKYGLHVQTIPTSSTWATTINFAYSNLGLKRQMIDSVGSSNRPQYRPFTNAWQSDAINDYAQRYIFTKGVTKTLIEWVNMNTAWSISGWTLGAFYLSTRGGVFGDNLGINISLSGSPYVQLNKNTLGDDANNWYKIYSFAPILIKWHFYTITYDGSNNFNNLKIYVDSFNLDCLASPGIVTASGSGITSFAPYSINTYGGINANADTFPNINAYYSGKFADFRIWINRVLTPQEVRTLYNGNYQTDIRNSDLLFRLPATLPSHFSATQILDISGNANNFTVVGQPSPTVVPFY